MIDVSLSFAWNPEFWGFGWTLIPIDGNESHKFDVPEFTGNCLAIRLVCLGIDVSLFSK